MTSTFWRLEAEVAGELGDGSVIDSSVHPPYVSKLEYRLSGWLGDELLETFPCYIVTEPLAKDLLSANFTGFQLDDVSVTRSEEFDELYPGRKLPQFKWLKVTGHAGVDDFGLSEQHTLIVSDRAVKALRRHTLDQCLIEQWVA